MKALTDPTRIATTDTHVPVGSQVTVTIGRNVGDVPMSLSLWNEFRDLVTDILRDHFTPTAEFGPFAGQGEWEGVTEESSVTIVITGRPADPAAVSATLADLAKWFGQDAVAWSYGPNLLATA